MEDHSSEEVIPSRGLPLSLPMTPDCAHPFELVPHPNNGLEDRGIRRFRNTTVAARAKLQFHQYTYAVVPDITTAIVPANTPLSPLYPVMARGNVQLEHLGHFEARSSKVSPHAGESIRKEDYPCYLAERESRCYSPKRSFCSPHTTKKEVPWQNRTKKREHHQLRLNRWKIKSGLLPTNSTAKGAIRTVVIPSTGCRPSSRY